MGSTFCFVLSAIALGHANDWRSHHQKQLTATVIAVVLVVYFALGSVGAWVGNFMMDRVPVP